MTHNTCAFESTGISTCREDEAPKKLEHEYLPVDGSPYFYAAYSAQILLRSCAADGPRRGARGQLPRHLGATPDDRHCDLRRNYHLCDEFSQSASVMNVVAVRCTAFVLGCQVFWPTVSLFSAPRKRNDFFRHSCGECYLVALTLVVVAPRHTSILELGEGESRVMLGA